MAVLFCTVLAVQRSVSVEVGRRGPRRPAALGARPGRAVPGQGAAVGAQLVVLEAVLGAGVVLLYGARVEHPLAARGVVRARDRRAGRDRAPSTGRCRPGCGCARPCCPFLLLPIVAPVLLAGTRIWQAAWPAASRPTARQWLRLLVVFDAVYLALGVVVFGPMQESA